MQVYTNIVALLGGILAIFGFVLILAGTGIITIKQYINIERMRATWVMGVILIVIGGGLLFTGELNKRTSSPSSPAESPEPELVEQIAADDPTHTPPPSTNETETPTPTEDAAPVPDPTMTPEPTATPFPVLFMEDFSNQALTPIWNTSSAVHFRIEEERLKFEFAAPENGEWGATFIEFNDYYQNSREVSVVAYSIIPAAPLTEPLPEQFAVLGFEAECANGNQLNVLFDQDARLIVNDENGTYTNFDDTNVLIPDNEHFIKLHFQDGEVELFIDDENITPTGSVILCSHPGFLKFLAGGSDGGEIQGYLDNISIEFLP